LEIINTGSKNSIKRIFFEGWGCHSMVKSTFNMFEAWGSSCSITKKNKKRERERILF
jgi:hypothetical protein